MNKSKIAVMTLISIISIFVLTGCLNPNIVLELEPDPIEFTKDNLSQEVTLKITTEGIGNITLDEFAVIVTDKNGNDIYDNIYEIKLEDDQFVFVGISAEENFTLDLKKIYEAEYNNYDSQLSFEEFYQAQLKGESLKLKIMFSGSINPTLETTIYLN